MVSALCCRVHLSAFNQYLADYPEPGHRLIHNTFSGAYVVLDADAWDELHAALASPDPGSPSVPDDLCDPDVGVVVPDLEREEREFRAWFAARRKRPSLDVVVGINLACNFACTYCSQENVLDGSVMKPAIAASTAHWIAERARASRVERIALSFVGGEPLLHPGRIEAVVAGIRAQLANPAVAISCSITTNGYLLGEDMVKRLTRSGLDHVKVTLDGDATTHCVTRVAKNGEDTFRRIFDHVIAASRHVRVTVNGNYQADTVGGFRPLIDELSGAGLPAGSAVSFSPALASFGQDGGDSSLACTWGRSDLAHHVALHDHIGAAGYDPGTLGAVGPCEFHDMESFAVGPTGLVYKCPGFLGQPSWAIGNVVSGLTGRYHEMLALTPKSTPCAGCSDRPNCGGGCLAAAWIREGTTEVVNCEKPYFDAVRPHALARGLATAMGEDPRVVAMRMPAPAAHEPPRALTQTSATPPARAIRSSMLRVLTT